MTKKCYNTYTVGMEETTTYSNTTEFGVAPTQPSVDTDNK